MSEEKNETAETLKERIEVLPNTLKNAKKLAQDKRKELLEADKYDVLYSTTNPETHLDDVSKKLSKGRTRGYVRCQVPGKVYGKNEALFYIDMGANQRCTRIEEGVFSKFIAEFDKDLGVQGITKDRPRTLTLDQLKLLQRITGHKRPNAYDPCSEKMANLIADQIQQRLADFLTNYLLLLKNPNETEINKISEVVEAFETLLKAVVENYFTLSEKEAKEKTQKDLKQYYNKTLTLLPEHQSTRTRSLLIGAGVGAFLGLGLGLLLFYLFPGINFGFGVVAIGGAIGSVLGVTTGGIFSWRRIYKGDPILSLVRDFGNQIEELINKSESQLEAGKEDCENPSNSSSTSVKVTTSYPQSRGEAFKNRKNSKEVSKILDEAGLQLPPTLHNA